MGVVNECLNYAGNCTAYDREHRTVFILDGKMVLREYRWTVVESLMDGEICDELSIKIAPCSEQEFTDAYVKKHLEKFGKDFVVN